MVCGETSPSIFFARCHGERSGHLASAASIFCSRTDGGRGDFPKHFERPMDWLGVAFTITTKLFLSKSSILASNQRMKELSCDSSKQRAAFLLIMCVSLFGPARAYGAGLLSYVKRRASAGREIVKIETGCFICSSPATFLSLCLGFLPWVLWTCRDFNPDPVLCYSRGHPSTVSVRFYSPPIFTAAAAPTRALNSALSRILSAIHSGM